MTASRRGDQSNRSR